MSASLLTRAGVSTSLRTLRAREVWLINAVFLKELRRGVPGRNPDSLRLLSDCRGVLADGRAASWSCRGNLSRGGLLPGAIILARACSISEGDSCTCCEGAFFPGVRK